MANPGMDTLNSVQAALIAANVGQKLDSSAEWMIFKGFMEDGPPVNDRAICLYTTPGTPPLEAWEIDYPGVQVVVRGTVDDYAAAAEKIQAVFIALHAQETAIGAAFVYFYGRQSAPISMGRDEKRRPSLGWNFRSMRNRPT